MDNISSGGSVMEKNLGNNERIIRIVVGFVLLFIGAMGGIFDLLLVVMMLAGILLLATGIAGNCPLYSITKKGKPSK